MDYSEEQTGEIEALVSIYDEDIEILSSEPRHKFQITVKSEEFESGTDNGLACTLVFAYPPKYPDELPEITIEEADNLDGGDQEQLLEYIIEQANENLGTVMVFTLVSATGEWLNEKWDHIKREREEVAVRKLEEEEEAERKKFEGTRVTVETFLNWKTKFDEEMNKQQRCKKIEGRLTGRELFLEDKTLNDSDLRYFETMNEKPVGAIDETLFEDCDFDDEDENDPDYVPA